MTPFDHRAIRHLQFDRGRGSIAKFNGGLLTLINSIVAQNAAAPASVDDNIDPADILTNTNNFLGGDPHLGPLQNNGGPTFTMAPLLGSPVINAGNTAAITPTNEVQTIAVSGTLTDSMALTFNGATTTNLLGTSSAAKCRLR